MFSSVDKPDTRRLCCQAFDAEGNEVYLELWALRSSHAALKKLVSFPSREYLELFARDLLEQHHVHFEPGVNEDLAATAVWGSQQANLYPDPRYDGVFGIWYGKGPGVDRSCDALKHGNYAGTAAHGGVLALAWRRISASEATRPAAAP